MIELKRSLDYYSQLRFNLNRFSLHVSFLPAPRSPLSRCALESNVSIQLWPVVRLRENFDLGDGSLGRKERPSLTLFSTPGTCHVFFILTHVGLPLMSA